MKIYVGDSIDGTGYAIFKSDSTPTQESHGHLYYYAFGPFRTLRGARFFAEHGKGNPHVQSVGDAERIAKRIEQETRRAMADRQLAAH